MKREHLVELMAQKFCDMMCEVSCDGRRSRYVNLKEWQKDRYRLASDAVLDLQYKLGTSSRTEEPARLSVVSRPEAARRLAISEGAVTRILEAGHISYYRDSAYRISEQSINDYISRRLGVKTTPVPRGQTLTDRQGNPIPTVGSKAWAEQKAMRT